MAVAITSKVNGVNNNLPANGTITVTGLTTTGASLILIAVQIGNNSTSSVSSATVNGSAATQAKAQLLPDGFSNSEIWFFWSSAALSSVSVVVNFSNSAGAGCLVLVDEATGTDASSIGNVGGAQATSGTSAASVTCSSTGSVMYGSALNFAGADTAGTNTAIVQQTNDAAGDFGSSSRNTQSTTSGTSYTITTTHTSQAWGLAIAEIKPAAAALTPNLPSTSDPVRRPPQPTRQHDAEWSSSQPHGSVVIPPIKPLHEAPQPAREARVLRHEGTFQPVQPLRSPVIPVPRNFGDAPPYYQTRVENPRALASQSAEAFGAPVIPTPKKFGDAPQPQTTRRRNERTTAHQSGEGHPAPAVFISRYPVVTTASSRKMFDQQGAPFRIKGRTAWGLASLGAALRGTFLDNTVGYGFNAIECQIPARLDAINNRPFGGDGSIPFLKRLDGATWTGAVTYGTINNEAPDFTTPNPSFWAFIDALVQDCYTRNILALIFPAYLGQGDGWLAELNANIAVNGDASINTYGAFVANRYKSYPNIVWMTAGDTASGFDAENDLIVGIQSVTGQASGPNFSSERFGGSISTDGSGVLGASTTLNGAYDWATVTTQCQRAYSFASPVMPGYLLEEPYDQEGNDGTGVNPTFSTQPTRRYEWWGWLNAIGGYVAGNGFVWRFALASTGPGTDDYRNGHLDTQATHDLGRLNAFMELWSNTNDLIPGGLGGMRTLVVSGAGTIDTGNFVCAAQTSTGDVMIGYTPPGGSGTFSLDLRSMAGRPIRARWWDPTAATFSTNGSAAGTYTLSNSASAQSFTSPGTNTAGDADWVLVLEAQAALSGVEVPEQVSRAQRASRSPFRIQNLDPLPGLAVPPAARGGFDLRPADRRQSRSPQPPPGSDGVLTAGLVDWDPIVPMALERLPKSPRPSINAEPLPAPTAPQSTPSGFDSNSPAARSFRAPSSAGGEAMPAGGPVDWEPTASAAPTRAARTPRPAAGGEPMPPPPFIPGGFEVAPAGARPPARPVILSAENLILPPPPFPPTFDVGQAIARALARLQLDQAMPLPGAGVADWTPDVYGDLARALRGRLAVDQDRFPGLAVVALPAWGFEPEPPRTRWPVADRRLVNGEPLRSPVAVVLTAWGYEPPPAPARGPRQDRRGLPGEPLPSPILAALIGWFDISGAVARRGGARLLTPGEPPPTAGPAAWVESAAPTLARGMPRGRAPAAGGDPQPLLVLTPWGWEPLAAARARAARNDARAAEPAPSPLVAAPIGFDPAAPMSRALRARLTTPNEPLPRPFIPGPLQPWGYDPSRPVARVSFAWARMDTGGIVLMAFTHAIPRTRVGAPGSRSGRSGGSTGHGGSGGPTRSGRS